MCMMHFQRWGFDPNSGRCVQFAYGGCGGNENNFETKEACEQICLGTIPNARPADRNNALDPVCRLPQDVGPCKAMAKRWSYDLSLGSCIEFYYGGCRGNANNFETKEACEAMCTISGAQPISNVDICKLPKKEGPCRGRNPRFYYDSASKQCLKFNYGGCRGNENNFVTKAECEARCAKAA
ncbi:unnamed protein product [Hymenolepis diminuta]|nr:unnamed protein product [Hymenolepis diminuta]